MGSLRGYALTVFLVAVVTAVELVAGNTLGRDAPSLLYALAILGAGWLGTARNALLATIASALACWVFLIPPSRSFAVDDPSTLFQVVAILLEGLAITVIVARLQLAREAAERSARRVARLQSLTAALAAARTPEEVGKVVAVEGMRAFGAMTGVVSRPVDRTRLELVASAGIPDDELVLARVCEMTAELPLSNAFRHGRPEWVETTRDFRERFADFPKAIAPSGAAAALPLMVGERPIGAMVFRFQEERSFSTDDRTLLETFAAQAAQSFDRAEVYEREVALRTRLEALGSLTAALSTALTREDVARIVAELGVQVAGADTCTLYERSEVDGALELIADRGIAPTILDRIRRLGHDPPSPVYDNFEARRSLWAETAEEYQAIYPALASIAVDGERARAFWSLPLVAEGKAIGLLAMGYFAPRRFTVEERAFVDTFTRHCAETLRRAQRLEAERVARATAERLQTSLATTLRSLGDGVIATDHRGKITLMNPVAEVLTGVAEDEARGLHLHEVVRVLDQRTRAEVENSVDRVLRGSTSAGLESHTLLVSRDGRETPIDESGAPLRGPSGRVEGVVLVFRDITQKKRQDARQAFLADATAALSESLDYQATLAKVAALAVPTLADWCSVYVLDEGARVPKQLAVAHSDPKMLEFARTFAEKYPDDPRAPSGIPNVLRTGRAELYSELTDAMVAASAVDAEHLAMIRSLRLSSLMLVPLAARGQVLGAISLVAAESGRHFDELDLQFAEDLARRCGTAVDNARLYAAEQKARHNADVANRAKDEFLATVSHELRTPLNAIMGWAKMLSAAKLDESKKGRAVETIERNAVAMAQLIEDLLDVSRIISGKMRLEVQNVDIARITEAAVDSIKPAADAKAIRIATWFEPIAGLSGDPARLQQIIWNLLSNAVKFTPNEGRVEVVVRRVDRGLELSVTDSGRGIEETFLPYVFDPFRQEGSTRARPRGGLGLGLAISKQLVELHGGRIEVRSEGEGKGSKFVVKLPLASDFSSIEPGTDRSARRIRARGDFERPTQLSGLRVLVVDDDEDARDLVRAVLEECGSQVVCADGVEAALTVLGRDPVDILISDIGMPGQDGYDLIRRVRTLPATRGGNVPAAALTAYARADDRRRVLAAGYAMHIPKPVEPAELVAAAVSLTRLLDRDPSARAPIAR